MLFGVNVDRDHLQNAGDQHAPGRGMTRARKPRGENKRPRHADVEQYRRACRRRETMICVERAGDHREHRGEAKIREGDARQCHREIEARAVFREARRKQLHHLRREDPRKRQQHNLDEQQARSDFVGEVVRLLLPILLQAARVSRNESGGERALGEDRAEMIGQPEGDEKRIRDRTRAKHRRHHDVAHKTRDARDQRPAADGEDVADHIAAPKRRRLSPNLSRPAPASPHRRCGLASARRDRRASAG